MTCAGVCVCVCVCVCVSLTMPLWCVPSPYTRLNSSAKIDCTRPVATLYVRFVIISCRTAGYLSTCTHTHTQV